MVGILCVNESGVIGNNGNLLYHIKEDMRLFKKYTIGNAVIMGRKTYESLASKPLKDRVNVVITSDETTEMDCDFKYDLFEVNDGHKKDSQLDITTEDINALEHYLHTEYYLNPNEIFLIGGGMLYNKLLPFCDDIIVTTVHEKCHGDTKIDMSIFDDFEHTSSTRLNVDEFDVARSNSPTFTTNTPVTIDIWKNKNCNSFLLQ